MTIHFYTRHEWLDACYQMMTKGATFKAFEPDGTNAMFYIELTGGF